VNYNSSSRMDESSESQLPEDRMSRLTTALFPKKQDLPQIKKEEYAILS